MFTLLEILPKLTIAHDLYSFSFNVVQSNNNAHLHTRLDQTKFNMGTMTFITITSLLAF